MVAILRDNFPSRNENEKFVSKREKCLSFLSFSKSQNNVLWCISRKIFRCNVCQDTLDLKCQIDLTNNEMIEKKMVVCKMALMVYIVYIFPNLFCILIRGWKIIIIYFPSSNWLWVQYLVYKDTLFLIPCSENKPFVSSPKCLSLCYWYCRVCEHRIESFYF